MADSTNILDGKKISELDKLPSNWSSKVVKNFLLSKGLLAVADSEGLNEQNPNTYQVSLQKLVDAFGLTEISQEVTLLSGLKDGCASVAFVDTDKYNITEADDGKTIRYAFNNISSALQTDATIIIILGSNSSSSEITNFISNTVSAKVIINLNSKLILNFQNTALITNNLSVKSKGKVILGSVSYGNGVNLIDIEAETATISSCSIPFIVRAKDISVGSISANTELYGSEVSLLTISNSEASVKVEANNVTFQENNNIRGTVNINASNIILPTSPINVTGGLLLLSIGSVVLGNENDGHSWIAVNASGVGAKVCAFVKSKPSFYEADTNYTGYTLANPNEYVYITYAGIFPSLYDAVVSNQFELVSALADASVKTIFLNGCFKITSDYEINGEKIFYGAFRDSENRYNVILEAGDEGSGSGDYDEGSGNDEQDEEEVVRSPIGSISNYVNLSFTIPVLCDDDIIIYGSVRFTDLFGNGSIARSGSSSNIGLYERNNSQLVLVETDFEQSYWFTPVTVPEYEVEAGTNINVEKIIEGNKTTFKISGEDTVPETCVTSNDNSLNVTSELNPQTNKKNVDLSVVFAGIQYGRYTSSILGQTVGTFTLGKDYGNMDLSTFQAGLYDISVYAKVSIDSSELVDDNVAFTLMMNNGDVFSKVFALDGSLQTEQVVFETRVASLTNAPVLSFQCPKLCSIELEFSIHSVVSGSAGSENVRKINDDCSNWIVSGGLITDQNLSWSLSKTSEDVSVVYDTLTVSIPNNIFCDIKDLPTTIVDGVNTYEITHLVVSVPSLVSGDILLQTAFQITFAEDNSVQTSVVSNGNEILFREIPSEYKASTDAIYQYSISNGCGVCAEFLK